MGVYDGNQLPEQPTSQFQMAVSVLYTLFVSVMVGIGAFAVLAAQQKPDKEATANLYMRMLQLKHNAVAHGILAFIPATYSLTHLYTSSLHNGSLYSASNIVYVAVFGFAAKYLGEALQALREDATHMDTIKAVYECLYMLTRSYARLRLHTPGNEKSVLPGMPSGADPVDRTVQLEPPGGRPPADAYPGPKVDVKVENLQGGSGRGASWLSPGWVLLNVFLAVGCQDDSRLWVMLPKWSLRWTWSPNVLDHFVPGTDSPGQRLLLWLLKLLGPVFWCSSICWPPKADKQQFSNTCCTGGHGCNCYHCYGAHSNCAYAYWLYSQGDCVRNYTGSLIIKQSIAEKLNQASYTTSRLYTTARRFLAVFATHFQDGLSQQWKANQNLAFTFRDEEQITFSEAVKCLRAVKFDNQALNMACERYMCRLTPAAAATCLPAETLLPALHSCWQVLFGAHDAAVLLQRLGDLPAAAVPQADSASNPSKQVMADGTATQQGVPPDQGTYLQAVTSKEAGYWCCLWLQYMHMVLLGIDLLRMHNNRELLDDTKQEKGFYDTLDPAQLSATQQTKTTTATAAAAAKAAADAALAAAAAGSQQPEAVDTVAAVAAAAASAVAVTAKKEHPGGLDCPNLHNLSDDNLHRFAALVASLLLANQMAKEAGSKGPAAARKVDISSLNIEFTIKTPTRDQDLLPAESAVSKTVLQRRSQLVSSHSSLPGIVQGVNCLPPSDWVDSLQSPLAAALLLVAAASISIATIACSNGVQLVTIAGSVQAFAAWALLTYISRLPVAGPPPSRDVCRPWLAQQFLGMLWVAVDVVLKLLITLLSLLNLIVPAELLTLLPGICCCCCFISCSQHSGGGHVADPGDTNSHSNIENAAQPANPSANDVRLDTEKLKREEAARQQHQTEQPGGNSNTKSPGGQQGGNPTVAQPLVQPGGNPNTMLQGLRQGGNPTVAQPLVQPGGNPNTTLQGLRQGENPTAEQQQQQQEKKKKSAIVVAAADSAESFALAAAGASSLAAVCAHAAGVYEVIGYSNCTCKFESEKEVEYKLGEVTGAATNLLAMAAAAELQYIQAAAAAVDMPAGIPVKIEKLGHVGAGLVNQGNTCYLNSLLQYLSHLPYLREAVYEIPVGKDAQPSQSLPLALQLLFYSVQYSNDPVSTEDFTKSIAWHTQDVYAQQDVHEFYMWLLDQLEKKLKGTVGEKAITDLFGGSFSTRTQCLDIVYESIKSDPFSGLELAIDDTKDIYECFDKFTARTLLTGKQIYDAGQHGRQDAVQTTKFKTLPPVLQLQLKRFGFEPHLNRAFKIHDHLEFFDRLDLDKGTGKYLSAQADQSVRNVYKLHSVLVHKGDVGGGHYFLYIRPDGKEWYLFNDSEVTLADKKEASQLLTTAGLI